MADELGKRVDKLEERLDQHLSVIHAFIDELREDRRAANKKIGQNERLITELVKINENVLRLIVAMDERVDRIEDRLGPVNA